MKLLKITGLAINTFKEAIRNRVLYTILAFSLMMIVASYYFGQLSVHENLKVIIDMGLSSLLIFGVIIAIFSGIGLVYKEEERRTIYNLIAKPVRRYEILLGKYFGLCLVMVVLIGVMIVIFLGVLRAYGAELRIDFIKVFLMIYIEVFLTIALALLFSALSSPTLAAIFTVGLYLVGHLVDDFYQLSARDSEKFSRYLAEVLRVVLPNFDRFDIKARIVHSFPVSWYEVWFALQYGLVWIVILLLIAALLFQRKNFR